MKKNKTSDALTGIEWAIAQSVGKPRQPDEFTIDEFFAAGGGVTRDAAEGRLRRMARNRELEKRTLPIGGSRTILYRRAGT